MKNVKKVIVTIATCGLLSNALSPVVLATQTGIGIEENSSVINQEEVEESSTTEESTPEETTETTIEESSTDSSSVESSTSSTTSTSSTSTTSSSSASTGTSSSQSTTPSSTQVKPAESGEQGKSTESATNGAGASDSAGISYKITKTFEGEEFIKLIGKDAQQVAKKNDIYASVMIAQAALESGYGNSLLASAPHHNLFGIKGSNGGKSVNMATLEENASGAMYQIRSNFRSYDSYKDSLEDYAKLLKGGITGNEKIYAGTWRENAKTYREATRSLTGVYATDSSYHKKLNAIIVAYKLTQYDNGGRVEEVKYAVKSGDTLELIAKAHSTTLDEIKKLNTTISDENVIHPGEVYVVKAEVKENEVFDVPLDTYEVTSGYGKRTNPSDGVNIAEHRGIDLAANTGEEIMASAKGEVVESGFNVSAGNYVIIEHADGYFTSYFHQSKRLVEVGAKVEQGDVIGLVGSTGDSTGPHLHFAISEAKWSDYLDPEELVSF